MRTLIAAALVAWLTGCGGSDKPETRGQSTENISSAAEEEAAILGREIFDLVDQAMSYRSSHRGRLPKSLRELGIDELTTSTSRSLSLTGNVLQVTVGFRQPAGRTLVGCRGTSAVLEEASLSGGEFSVICNLVQGGSTTLRARR